MKNKIRVVISVLLLATLSFSIYASNGMYIKLENEIDIEFKEDSKFTEEEQKRIINYFSGINEPVYTPYNIICFLLGHNTTTDMIIVTYHRIYDEQPRCRKDYMDVTTCSRCDYLLASVVASVPITCCD